jgi:hypothetical protein
VLDRRDLEQEAEGRPDGEYYPRQLGSRRGGSTMRTSW